MNETDTPQTAGLITDEPGEFVLALIAGRRLLGLDLGTKTIGLAISDVTRTIASPLEIVKRKKFTIDAEILLARIAEHQVCGLVLGLPRNLDGSEGPRAQSSRAFARNIARLCMCPVLLWDERLTTVAAERVLIEADQSRRRRKQVIDKLAANLILQTSMDRMKAFDNVSDDRGD